MDNIEKKDSENNNDKYFCEVNIYGDKFKLVSKDYDFDKLKLTANEVNRQMKVIAERYPDVPKYKIAILVALNMTDNLFKLKESISNIKKTDKSSSKITNNEITADTFLKEEEIIMRIEKLISDVEQVL